MQMFSITRQNGRQNLFRHCSCKLILIFWWELLSKRGHVHHHVSSADMEMKANVTFFDGLNSKGTFKFRWLVKYPTRITPWWWTTVKTRSWEKTRTTTNGGTCLFLLYRRSLWLHHRVGKTSQFMQYYTIPSCHQWAPRGPFEKRAVVIDIMQEP